MVNCSKITLGYHPGPWLNEIQGPEQLHMRATSIPRLPTEYIILKALNPCDRAEHLTTSNGHKLKMVKNKKQINDFRNKLEV
jgi:hypothetical protein